MKRTDLEIKTDVINELKWDTRVDETAIGVAVAAGAVTLTGTVSSWGQKLAAQQAAHRVKGVLDVANDITVKVAGSYQRTDTDIAQAVRSTLEWDVFVPEQRIRSTVSDGWVTLEGDVDYWTHKADAERAVRDLAGVRGVTNKIEITSPKAGAYEVRRALEEALERHAERDAKHIQIDVRDGKVSLTGIVHSLAEKQAVVGAARGTSGVRDVIDRLSVVPRAAE